MAISTETAYWILATFDRLYGIVLIVDRRSGAGEVIDLIDLQQDGLDHIMADQFKVRFAQQVANILLLAGEEVIEADDIMPLGNESVAQVRTQKSGPAGNEDTFERVRHRLQIFSWA